MTNAPHTTRAAHRAQSAAWLRQARGHAGLSLRALAQRASTSHTTLCAYEQGRKSPTLDTFMRIIEACSLGVEIRLTRRIREHNGVPRGQELEAVLDLAAQFPAKHAADIEMPPFRVQA